MNTLNVILTIIGFALTVVSIVQWQEARTRSHHLIGVLTAIHKISKRMGRLRPKDDMVKQKALDICDSIEGATSSIRSNQVSWLSKSSRKGGGKK